MMDTVKMTVSVQVILVLFMLTIVQQQENVVVHASSPVFQVDGSGVTSVQECLWDLMHRIETSSSVPVRLSYRGLQDSLASGVFGTAYTGTQFAEEEFLRSILKSVQLTSYTNGAEANATKSKMTSLPMFVAVDGPVRTELYKSQFEDTENYGWDKIAFNGGQQPENDDSASRFVQIPVLASPIGFFHSVPQSTMYDTVRDNDDAMTVWNTTSSENLVDGNNEDPSEMLDPDEMDAIQDIESIYEDQSAIELYVDACTIMKLYDGTITSWMDVLEAMPDSMPEEYGKETASNNVTSVRVVAMRGESLATLAVTTVSIRFFVIVGRLCQTSKRKFCTY
jgi:hypothetical protein